MSTDPEDFYVLGCRYLNHNVFNSRKAGYRRFKTMFGVSPLICSIAWDKIDDEIPYGAKFEHILWALCFLKCYHTESVNHAIFGIDEKTYRKWTWIFVDLLSSIKMVYF